MTDEQILVVAHWPGQDTVACPTHLQKLVGLAGVMGFALSWTSCDDPEAECGNCRTLREREKNA